MTIRSIIFGSGIQFEYLRKIQNQNSGINRDFGNAVAISGDSNYIAAADKVAGSVQVFRRIGQYMTNYSQISNTADSLSMSENGSYIAVGNSAFSSSRGVVYIYNLLGTLLSTIVPGDIVTGDRFGVSISISSNGDTLAIGATGANLIGGDNDGAVYVYTRSGSTWTQQAKIRSGSAAQNSYFGKSVSLSGDGNTLVIGSTVDSGQSGLLSGAVYVYTRSGSTWTQQAKIFDSAGVANDRFGDSVSISNDGNTIAVTSPQVYIGEATDGGSPNRGAAYIHTRSGSTWTQQAKLPGSKQKRNPSTSKVYLSKDGNTLLFAFTGSFVLGPQAISGGGIAFVYSRAGNVFSEIRYINDPGGESFSGFGTDIAISFDGQFLIIGAPDEDGDAGGTTDNGVIYTSVR